MSAATPVAPGGLLSSSTPSAIAWVPSAYFAEGVPYAIATWAAGTMLKDLGHSDGDITVATAFIGLAWSLKPLWAAFVDRYKTKKFFVISMQIVMTGLLAAMGLALGVPDYLPLVIAALWLLAFASATQDICIDGIYITSLDDKRQSAWMGVQGVAWVLGRIFATMAVVWLAGRLERAGFAHSAAWTYALCASAGAMGALAAYHHIVLPTGSIPRGASDGDRAPGGGSTRVVVGVSAGIVLAAVLGHFFSPTLGLVVGGGAAASILVGWRDHVPPFLALVRKKAIWGMLAFVLLYRTGEGFLLQEAPLFLQSALDKGGVGLGLEQKSLVDGLSTIASLGGGLLGGAVAARVLVRLRRQHALHDAADRPRPLPHDALRVRDGLHAARADSHASRERKARRLDGLPELLRLRHGRVDPEHHRGLESAVSAERRAVGNSNPYVALAVAISDCAQKRW